MESPASSKHDSAPGGRNEATVASIVTAAALAGFYFGWRAYWFLCDDAYIAFRYVANHQLGYGFVWNPPPFLPVEGYTSFLWVALLDAVWTLTDVDPAASSNWLGLAFGSGSVLLTAWMTWRLPLSPKLRTWRGVVLALVLLGLVTNASFLTWSSSGLETPLFNFLVLLWVAAALWLPRSSVRWIFATSFAAGLLALTRPDGWLMIGASGALLLLAVAGPTTRPPIPRLLWAWPLLLPVVHLLWRRTFYGQWLPNSYYAKVAGAWPEAGVRYAASFVLEYGLWLWVGLAIAGLSATLRHWKPRHALRDPAFATRVVVLATLAAHLGYYTFVVGGDHFEYRIYSHLPALLGIGAVWLADRLVAAGAFRAGTALVVLFLVIAVSWPIPWLTWAQARPLTQPSQTRLLTVPMAPFFPAALRGYAEAYDQLQHWLIRKHAIALRQRSHLVFARHRLDIYGEHRLLDEELVDQYPVLAVGAVGVAGWVLARVNVIDRKGLNDYVVARGPTRTQGRRIAHDRMGVPGYEKCFRPNVTASSGRIVVAPRSEPLTPQRIRACERRFRALVDRPDSLVK